MFVEAAFTRQPNPVRLLVSALIAALCLGPVLNAAPVKAEAPAPGMSAEVPAYRLQPGDEVSIAVSPQKSYDVSGIILPDGKLYLRGAGGVQAAGLTLEELAGKVRTVLAMKLVSPRVVATITKLAPKTDEPDTSVTLTGAVAKTGALTVPPGTRIQKALDLVGGASPNADLTRVAILHKDLTRTTVDLSTPERRSDPAHNRALKDGDSIEVTAMPVQSATVLGAVVKPGGLNLMPGLRVRDVLDAAGGLARDADLARVSIRHRDQSLQVVDLSTPEALMDGARNLVLQDGDVVEVPTMLVAQAKVPQIRIAGEVENPGSYPYKPGMTLDDLIIAAGRFGSTADVEQIQIKRAGEPVRTVDLFQQQKLGLEGKVLLEPEDEAYVPARENSVLFIGAVAKPGAFGLKPGQTLGRLLSDGNPELAAMLDASRADLRNAEVIRPGEARKKVDLINALRSPGDKKKDVVLKPGDMVYLPPRRTDSGGGFFQKALPFIGLFSLL